MIETSRKGRERRRERGERERERKRERRKGGLKNITKGNQIAMGESQNQERHNKDNLEEGKKRGGRTKNDNFLS